MIVVRGVRASKHSINIEIAACAQQIVDTATVFVDAVPGQRILDDRTQGPYVGQTGPQPIERRDVRGVELFRSSCPELFSGVAKGPDVEVAWGFGQSRHD